MNKDEFVLFENFPKKLIKDSRKKPTAPPPPINPETYGKVCQDIADWIHKDSDGKFDLSSDDIMTLHNNGEFMIHIHEMKGYMDAGLNASDMLISVEHIAKLVMRRLHRKGQIDLNK